MTGGLNRWVATVLIGVLVAVIAIGLVWLPYDPLAMDIDHVLAPPSSAHWFGTDEFGRDVATRAMMGARISAALAVQTVIATLLVGVTLGLLAGFLRGWFERTVMTLTDAILAFPSILLALGLVAVLGAGRRSIVLALALAYLPATVRVVRAAVLSIREREYIEASRVAGDGALYTMLRHVLPNAVAPIIVLATAIFGWAVLAESALSFLGVGVPPPAPTWGNMLSSARPYMTVASWLSIAPGLCIVATLLGVNMLGDALRDRLDTRTAR